MTKLSVTNSTETNVLGLRHLKVPVGLLAQIGRHQRTTVKLQIASNCSLRDKLGY